MKKLLVIKNIMAIAVVSLLLAGCGGTTNLVSSSPRTVVISAGDAKIQEAQDMADKECKKNGRFARMIGKPTSTSSLFTFDCVE